MRILPLTWAELSGSPMKYGELKKFLMDFTHVTSLNQASPGN